MRMIHTMGYVDQEASGLVAYVPKLCDALGRRGHDVTLMTLQRGVAPEFGRLNHMSLQPSFGLSRIGASNAMLHALIRGTPNVDLLHLHSLWLMPNVYPAWAAQRFKKPLFASPHGTLGAIAMSYSRRRKLAFWALLQGNAVRRATVLHATSEQEYRELRAFGLRQPVVVIPSGIPVPDKLQSGKVGTAPRRLLFLARLHPKKGLDILLKVWKVVSVRFPAWELHIVGPNSHEYGAKMQRLSSELALERVKFVGPRYGMEKRQEYAAADLYVLPSLNENFGISIAEALAEGVPVVTTTATPWQGLRGMGCGWWVEPTCNELALALTEALALSSSVLESMGDKGRVWMSQEFSWDSVAVKMETAYQWIINGGPAPATAHMD